MEVAVPDLAGSLGGGGRYDGLIGMFSGENIPACGFSLGLERILVVMGERDMFPPDVEPRGRRRDGDAVRRRADRGRAAAGGELRAAGLRVEVYPEPDKLGSSSSTPPRAASAFVTVVGARRTGARRSHDQGHDDRRADRRSPRRRSRRDWHRGVELAAATSPEQSDYHESTARQLARTHTCGELDAARRRHRTSCCSAGCTASRDLGSLVFIDIRDRHGMTQVVARDNDGAGRATPSGCARSSSSRCSAAWSGARRNRSTRRCKTGEIEVEPREIRLLNDAKTPPFPIADETPVSEDTRLKYRYLDLRRAADAAQPRSLRHRATMEIRKYFDEHGFLEIETPMLTKSTPEGARDYLVPSRVHPGEFYALPQSPQIFKQILMIAGMDRYFQIVKCFRDEDLRADRQPEFTQVDLEISFATEDLVFATIEPLMERLMALIGREAPRPFLRHAVCRGDREVRIRQARPAVRDGDCRTCRRRSPTSDVRACSATRSRPAARCAGSSSRARRRTRGASSTSSSSRPSSSARRAWSGRGAPEATVQSSALKAAGEAAIRQALETCRRAAPATCC